LLNLKVSNSTFIRLKLSIRPAKTVKIEIQADE